jgi:hypothetical protein
MDIQSLKDLKNTDLFTLECNHCRIFYDRKVRDIKTSLRLNKFRNVCHTCAKYEKKGRNKNCTLCNQEYYVTTCNADSKFCSKSCAAKFNNTLRKTTPTLINKASVKKITYGVFDKRCLNCQSEFSGSHNIIENRKYCSISCSTAHRRESNWAPIRDAIDRGEIQLRDNIESNNSLFRKYLIEKYGSKCMRCGWSEVNQFTNRIPIELEHKDGNCSNNNLINLELLCPNCHSLTATYKGANRRDGGSPRYAMWKNYFK